jgi:Family of unknown function (DUF6461)
MTTPPQPPYSSDWVDEEGLDVTSMGYCITVLRGVDPREALQRLGAADGDVREGTWAELREPQDGSAWPKAAFVIDGVTVVVEDGPGRAQSPGWSERLSTDTEAVSASYGINGESSLVITRSGELVAFVDGDSPDDVDSEDEELAARLIGLIRASLQPFEEGTPVPDDLGDDGVDGFYADLLQVACDYVGLRPTVADVSGPVLGARLDW